MEEVKEISEKEKERRRKLSVYRKKVLEEKRVKGYKAYIRRKRKEIRERERKKAREKEKERKRKEREKAKPKKRRVGRPKKSGPKKKYWRKKKKPTVPKVNPRNSKPPYLYKIVSCKNGVQNKFIGKYRTIEEAYAVFNDLKMKERMIVFPRLESVDHTLLNSIDEYVIIEKSDKGSSVLRNEYGKLVEQKTNIDGWIVLDKWRYHEEESFWVWGYDSKKDRKNFAWIYNSFIIENIGTSMDYIRVILYKNKVIFKYDDESLEIVFCKSESDSIRMYNKIEEWVKRDKIKRVMFLGDYSPKGERRRKIEDEIMALTGWTRRKVQMKNTTYYLKF
jgi:hypothetical protein